MLTFPKHAGYLIHCQRTNARSQALPLCPVSDWGMTRDYLWTASFVATELVDSGGWITCLSGRSRWDDVGASEWVANGR